jgi:hypothetical protein
MVAMRTETRHNQHQYYVSPFTSKMERLYLKIHLRQRDINNMIAVFRDDEEINAMQCQEASERLRGLWVAARSARQWLKLMHLDNAEYLHPHGTIAQLEALESNITETILLVSVFVPRCQESSIDRVEMQLCLRESMIQVKRSLCDCVEQFGALVTLAEDMGVCGE